MPAGRGASLAVPLYTSQFDPPPPEGSELYPSCPLCIRNTFRKGPHGCSKMECQRPSVAAMSEKWMRSPGVHQQTRPSGQTEGLPVLRGSGDNRAKGLPSWEQVVGASWGQSERCCLDPDIGSSGSAPSEGLCWERKVTQLLTPPWGRGKVSAPTSIPRPGYMNATAAY